MQSSVRNQVKYLLCFLIIFGGFIIGFGGVFSLGTKPLPPLISGPYYVIFAGVSAVIIGFLSIFRLTTRFVRLLMTLLIIIMLIPIIFQIIDGYYFMFGLLILDLLLSVIMLFVPQKEG